MSGSRCRRRGAALWVLVVAFSVLAFEGVQAADLYKPGAWPALASDRRADRVGDSVTVIVNESSSGSNSAQTGSSKTTHVAGALSAGTSFNKSADLSLSGAYGGNGQTGRSGAMVAQISVVVDAVLPNGDLHVAGERLLTINGDPANIRLRGRIRREDIAAGNTILSTQLADVSIDYNGAGFSAHGAKPGPVARIFSWLGVL
ncbi:MAG: flagellar basal body L-ring protein FlgH [Caulobacteraceae bacterium]|nr:flagellar basal body L-ring protein FlgH [Caulobacteraceae bacterium]